MRFDATRTGSSSDGTSHLLVQLSENEGLILP
jgi:hypothetical protein